MNTTLVKRAELVHSLDEEVLVGLREPLVDASGRVDDGALSGDADSALLGAGGGDVVVGAARMGPARDLCHWWGPTPEGVPAAVVGRTHTPVLRVQSLFGVSGFLKGKNGGVVHRGEASAGGPVGFHAGDAEAHQMDFVRSVSVTRDGVRAPGSGGP